jgi:GT2 family glycosyltransferase
MVVPPLAVVVVNWNGAEMTLRCLRSLSRSARQPDHFFVVDNGSSDDSVLRLRAALGSNRAAKLIEAGANRGYAGGNNLGIERALAAGAASVLILNNDIELEPDCIGRLEAALAAPGVGAVGPIILFPPFPGEPRRIWAAGGEVTNKENVSRLRGNGHLLNGRYGAAETVDYLPGCALLVRREVLEKVGSLDEAFFCYMEDVEFGKRITDAGYANRFVPDAIAFHDASASTGGGYTPARKYMNAANSVRYLRRHPSARGWIGFAVYDVLLWPLCLLYACVKGRPSAAFAKFSGLIDGLRGVTMTAAHIERYLPRPLQSKYRG